MLSVTRKSITLGSVALLIGTAATIALAAGDGHAPQADGIKSKVLTEENKVFTPQFGPVEFADAFGSRETGPHGTFGRFPAGFETPAHIHSHGYRAVVLKGVMTNPFEGEENPPKMNPGSYWSVKAGELHTTACISETPCEFLMWGGEDFDFVPK